MNIIYFCQKQKKKLYSKKWFLLTNLHDKSFYLCIGKFERFASWTFLTKAGLGLVKRRSTYHIFIPSSSSTIKWVFFIFLERQLVRPMCLDNKLLRNFLCQFIAEYLYGKTIFLTKLLSIDVLPNLKVIWIVVFSLKKKNNE